MIHVPSGEKSLAKPTTAEGSSSPFVFELKKAEKGDLMVLHYPADRTVSASGGSASFDFPAKQDGTAFSPLYLGSCTHTGSAFSAGKALRRKKDENALFIWMKLCYNQLNAPMPDLRRGQRDCHGQIPERNAS